MRLLILILILASAAMSQVPPIEPGVSQELAKWRAAHYSDVRYKLNLTLEKMSPVLKGTMEIRLNVTTPGAEARKFSNDATGAAMPPPPSETAAGMPPIILDWRKIKGHEEKSTISNVSINGKPVVLGKSDAFTRSESGTAEAVTLTEENEHLVFRNGVVLGENVIKLDFISPILTSGSAITRYVDKEDGSEYIYSLFVPSDASTAFPVFDQPDLKAKFSVSLMAPDDWTVVSNAHQFGSHKTEDYKEIAKDATSVTLDKTWVRISSFAETKPISTYVFAFAAGPWTRWEDGGVVQQRLVRDLALVDAPAVAAKRAERENARPSIYLRKSQVEKFKSHAAEVFRLNREAIKYFEEYFDSKFPFPKYDLVLIPEFPFGGMEHAGATFLRESAIIFPQEPTKNDLVSRAVLIFHEAAHQWFGDTVTMRWFDDLWLKEGFATFMAYKAMERVMPEMNSWKVFYERVKQGAYQTDSTKGTTPIYQEIKNLSAAKSAYGAIVYNKAPAFLRQAEFYLGEDKFRTAVRAFLKKHEFANAGWEDLVEEFANAAWFDPRVIYHPQDEEAFRTKEVETYRRKYIKDWANSWVNQPGLPTIKVAMSDWGGTDRFAVSLKESERKDGRRWNQDTKLIINVNGQNLIRNRSIPPGHGESQTLEPMLFSRPNSGVVYVIPNYQDYGYGIFLLDDKSREYVLKNIQNEKDPFLRSMMWGALWDSVREGELDPRAFVELVVKVLMQKPARSKGENNLSAETDESTTALLLNRVGTAMNYYIDAAPTGRQAALASGTLAALVENMLIERMQTGETLGQRITYYRAFLNIASSENGRKVLKAMLRSEPPASAGGLLNSGEKKNPPATAGGTDKSIPLKTKDRFDIVTRLLILNDPDAPGLLAELEKKETSDDAKRYAYAAKAGIPTAENKAKYWNDFTNNKEISESWIEAAFGPWNSTRHSARTLPYLQKALQELPNHKRNRKIFFVNGWLGAFIGGQRSEEALNIVNKFLSDNPNLDKDLRLKILENVDLIERGVKIRSKYK